MKATCSTFIAFCVIANAFSTFGAEIPPGRLTNPPGLQSLIGSVYNAAEDEYLFAYFGGGDAFAWRLNPDSTFSGLQVELGTNSVGDQINVAYNGDRNEYLVIWRTTGGNMYGRYVSGDGQPLGDVFFIQASVGPHELDYSPVAGNYIAIYRKGPAPIKTRFVILDGDSTAPSPVITSGTVETNADSAKIACGSPTMECLVVFVANFSGSAKANVNGRFMSGTGAHIGNTFGIATGFENQQVPDVGYSDTHGRWLVTFEDWSTGGFPDVKAHYVDEDRSVSARFNTTPGDSEWNTTGPIVYNSSVDKFYRTQFRAGARIRDVDPFDMSLGDSMVLNGTGVATDAAARPHPVRPQVFVVTRTGFGADGVHAHTLDLPPPPPSFTGSTMPDGFFGVPYTGMVPVVGGTQPLVYELVSGTLAPPLTGPDANGNLNGTPNAIGVFGPFRIRVTDDEGRSAEADLTHEIKLAPPVLIGPTQATNDTTPTFMWSPSPGATSYRLVVNILGGATVLDQAGIGGTSYTPSLAQAITPGLYEWKVSATDGVNTSPFSAPLTLEIDVLAPEAVVLEGSLPQATTAVPGLVVDSVSSQHGSPTLVQENAVDGDVNTDWQTEGTTSPKPEFIIVDLGGEFQVSGARLRSDNVNAIRFPRDFDIDVSFDKSIWVTLDGEVDFVADIATWYEFTGTPTLARYVRVMVHDENNYAGWYLTRLAEIEVLQSSAQLGSFEACWDAPGDDPGVGTAAFYDLRYMQGMAADFNYAGASQVTDEPAPLAEGTRQCDTIDGLLDETTYSAALTTVDDAGNISAISNILEMSTRGIPPTAIADLQASDPDKTTADLSWTPPTDVGSGVAVYDARFSTSPITAANFDMADELTGEPTPGSFGDGSMTATGLPSNATVYFAVKSMDFKGNVSFLSNVVSIDTLDGKPPGQVTDLVGSSGGATLVDVTPLVAVDASGERVDKGFLKENAVDGDPATVWMSPPATSATALTYITVDLGSTVDVAQISLLSDDGNGWRFPQDFWLQVSDDPFDGFDTIHSVSDLVSAPSTWYTYDVTPTSGRYVRIFVTEMDPYAGTFLASIAEIKVSRQDVLAGGFVLQWSAPADDFDSNLGGATFYDVRYSPNDIVTDNDFNNATQVNPLLLPTPQPFGFTETLTLTGFGVEEVLYVAMTATDDNDNTSVRSNTVKVATPGTPPDQVVGLSITGATGSTLTLQWTASADDEGNPGSGAVERYDVRCATTPIAGLGDFLNAPLFAPGPTPVAPGNTQTFVVSPLSNQTTYYCGVLAVDDAENASILSAIVMGSTLDEVAPGLLGNLEVSFEVSALPLTVDSASSERDSRFLKENAADGDPASDWMSQALTTIETEWIVFDLGSVQPLGEVRLLSDDGNAARFPKGFKIQVSTDKMSWDDVRNESNFVATPSTWYPFPFVETPGRYVRIWVTDMTLYGSWYFASFAEIEVYASGGPQVLATLSWLATGDDGNLGTANLYEVRFDTDVIDDEASFTSATPASGVPPLPLAPGTSQSFTISDGLMSETEYYLAVKTSDEAGNASITVTNATTPAVDGSPVDLDAPGQLTNLQVAFAPASLPLTVDSVSSERDSRFLKENIVDGDLSTDWMSEAITTVQTQWIIVDLGSVISIDEVQLRSDDGNAYRFPTDFEVQVSTDKSTWTMVGSETNFSATPSTWYSYPFAARSARYVRVWVTDMNLYAGAYYMASFAELQVTAATATFQATLSWNATGDDGTDGTAFSYDIRFDTAVINDEASFNGATEVDGEPSPAPSGNAQMFNLPAPLTGGTLYYFAIKTSDEVGNFSLTFVSGSTP